MMLTHNDQDERLTLLICYLSVIKIERENPVLQGWNESERRTREGFVPLASPTEFWYNGVEKCENTESYDARENSLRKSPRLGRSDYGWMRLATPDEARRPPVLQSCGANHLCRHSIRVQLYPYIHFNLKTAKQDVNQGIASI